MMAERLGSRVRGWRQGARGARVLLWALVALVPALAMSAACSGVDKDRPPPVGGCADRCGPPGTGGPGSGSGGGGGGMGGAPASTTTLTGTVVSLNEDSFVETMPFTATATVFAETPSGGQCVSGIYDGMSFTIPGALADRQAWVAVRPTDTAGFVDTFSYPDTTQSSLTVPVVSRTLLEEIFFNLATPAEIDANAAQVVLRVFQANGVGVTGVTANTPAGQFIAYSANGAFSETETVTDVQGVILIGNVTASRFPGTELAVHLGGAAKADLTVRIARGFVTLVNVVVLP